MSQPFFKGRFLFSPLPHNQFYDICFFSCAIDRYLLDNLEYGPGLLQAQKEAHAFKFADRVVVNFQCSIRLDIKDGECPVYSLI